MAFFIFNSLRELQSGKIVITKGLWVKIVHLNELAPEDVRG
jgi:hypothetical protein